jgi:hypothetical protein
MRREKVRAKNVAQELAGSFRAGASRDELLVLMGLAKLPRCPVEGPGDLLGGNHLPSSAASLLPLNTALKYSGGEDYKNLQPTEIRRRLEQAAHL